jgi:hypothetical protein
MRLQSVPLYKISDFLKSKGPDHYIPPTTICRNIAEALAKGPPDEFEQTAAEQQAERWGGKLDLNLEHELIGQFVLQRRRLDILRKQEEARRIDNPNHLDKRIKPETELLLLIARQLRDMSISPAEAQREYLDALEQEGGRELELSQDAEDVLTDLVINGDLRMSSSLIEAAEDA